MGLVSYIKDLYYNSRLNKADNLLSEGRVTDAENIFTSILDKHPLAVAKFADYLYSTSKSANVSKIVSLFERVIALERKGGQVYDANAYNTILSRFADDMVNKAQKNFALSKYEDCSTLLTAINRTKCRTNATTDLCCESDTNIIVQKIDSTKFTNKDFLSLIDDLKKLWERGQRIPQVKETILKFCEKLKNGKRYYVAATILSIILGDKYHKDCLRNIAFVVSGDDSEINPKVISDVVANYGKELVLHNEQSLTESVSIFDKCWQRSSSITFVLGSLDGAGADLQEALLSHVILYHQAYLSNSDLLSSITKWISDNCGLTESIDLYEKVLNAGYNVENFYVDKVHKLSETLAYDERVKLFNKALAFYPKSAILLDDTLYCAKWYESQGYNAEAIKICDVIISNCKKAKVVKAKALCNIANKESDIDKRVQYIAQASSVLANSKEAGASEVNAYIQQSYLDSAEQYYTAGRVEDCYAILDSLVKLGNKKAVSSMVNHYLSEVKSCSDNNERFKKVVDVIDKINTYKIPNIASVTEYCMLWSEKINLCIELNKSTDHSTAVSVYQRLLDDINAICFDDAFASEHQDILRKQIIERKYIVARELEKSNNLKDAALTYKEINGIENKRVPTLSALRFILCKLKSQGPDEILQHKAKIYSLLKNAAKAYKAEKDDIAYRFALSLLKAGEDAEALSVLSEYLPNEVNLKKACEQGAMIKAQAKLEDFNRKLEAVKNNSLSADDAIYFINHMLEYAEVIKPVLDLPRAKLSKYRAKLKNYAIFKLFNEGKYNVAFEKMIKEHPDYLEDLTVLRNIAVVCLNMAESNQLNSKNYQEVISAWLTAIYQERLFVKSLDYTSWDNQFKFTLQNAYGHYDEFAFENLPDNVNFDDPEENVIVSIREVQRILLDRFEASISESQTYHGFFTAQKDAMDALINLNLDEKCTMVAPFLASKNEDIYEEIADAFNKELEGQYGNWEEALAVGVRYELEDPIYEEYSVAKELFDKFKSALTNKNNSRIFTTNNVAKIKKFGNMYSALISFVGSNVSALKSDQRTAFKSNFDFYNAVCLSIGDRTISFSFSNYVMQYIVGEVNNNRMKHAEASKYILSIYTLDPTNARVKENLTTLFEMLARDKSADAVAAVNSILGKVQTVDSAFYRKLNAEYTEAKIDKELNEIVDKVNGNSMSAAQALSKVYSIYENNSNNERVCENLVQLCDMCIMKYIIQQEYGGSTVAGILDRIYNNMSSEFKNRRGKFAQSYNAIWGQLPSDAKLTIQGFNPNATLNDSGRALKKGLEYYKKFGGVTKSSSLSDILGL